MALVDALGNLLDFRLMPGQAHDLRGMAALIEGLTYGPLLADRAFDAKRVREALAGVGIEAVIIGAGPAVNPPVPRWTLEREVGALYLSAQ